MPGALPGEDRTIEGEGMRVMYKNLKVIGATVIALPLAVGGLVAANSQLRIVERQSEQVSEMGFTCPVTGEELPCERCCVLNQSK